MASKPKGRRVKPAIYAREDGRCFWCETPLRYEYSTLDHIVPRSRGGSNEQTNMVLSCRPCNNERDVMPAETFLVLSIRKLKQNSRL